MMPDRTTAEPVEPWMFIEMREQPLALATTLKHYVQSGRFIDSEVDKVIQWLGCGKRVLFLASGSSRHASLVGARWLKDTAGLDADIEFSSEYLYQDEAVLPECPVIVVSQSGETADTLKALRRAISLGRNTIAVTNVADSSTAKEAMASMPSLAGRERAIPATKSFTCQLLVLQLIALIAASIRGTLPDEDVTARLSQIETLPQSIEEQWAGWNELLPTIASQTSAAHSFLFIGRETHYPIACEGALKLKESSYVPAEGYPSGELKHGPNALVSDTVPIVMLCTVDHSDVGSVLRYEKSIALLKDMKEQSAFIIVVANNGDREAGSLASLVIPIRVNAELLLPMIEIIPLQLFAYYVALSRDVNVDSPRNLVKAVLKE